MRNMDQTEWLATNQLIARRVATISLLWLVVCVVLAVWLVVAGQLRFRYAPVSILALPLGFLALRWLGNPFTPTRPACKDDRLTERAKLLASKIDVDLKEVRLIGGKEGLELVVAFAARGPRVFITEKMLEILPDDALGWLLAHELAHHSRQRMGSLRKASMLAKTAFAVSGVLLWLVGEAHHQASAIASASGRTPDAGWIFASWAILGVGIAAAGLLSLAAMRRMEYEADRVATEMTGFDAAMSAYEAVFGQDGDPWPKWWPDWLNFEPKPSSRVSALRHMASLE